MHLLSNGTYCHSKYLKFSTVKDTCFLGKCSKCHWNCQKRTAHICFMRWSRAPNSLKFSTVLIHIRSSGTKKTQSYTSCLLSNSRSNIKHGNSLAREMKARTKLSPSHCPSRIVLSTKCCLFPGSPIQMRTFFMTCMTVNQKLLSNSSGSHRTHFNKMSLLHGKHIPLLGMK